MRRHWPSLLLLSAAIALPSRATAQNPTQAGAAKSAASAEAAVGTSIADRTLAGAAESFPASTDRLYCFSRITNAANTEIEHVWYKGDVEQGRVRLKVGGSPWRTYSSKTLPPDRSGEWRCDVVQAGTVLKSITFRVE